MKDKNHLKFDEQETIGEDLLFNINYYKAIFRGGAGKVFFPWPRLLCVC